jgi:hypothetical protein
MIAILTGMRWNLSVVLVIISLMNEDFFMSLMVTCTSFENYNSFAHLLIGIFVLLIVNLLSSL